MSISTIFENFLNNLKVDNSEQITDRYEEITACLNKRFRDSDSKQNNRLQVGSYGRWTGVKGISDLDMLYIMPKSAWDDYNVKDGQSKLLTEARETIQNRYPKTTVKVDRLVVTVTFSNFYMEVQPVFEQDDGSFKYPDSHSGGSWKITKPREEITAMKEFVDNKNKNLRRLCKMIRTWKNKHGIEMGGLLIDTLAYNFLKNNSEYDDKSYLYYDWMSRDFFKYLMNEPDKDYYSALGSNQRVKVKKKFQKKAEEAYNLCLEAIDATEDLVHDKWKKVYGRLFPSKPKITTESFDQTILEYKDTEEFIEDICQVDIKYSFNLDCEVTQDGFRTFRLTDWLLSRKRLSVRKKLHFYIEQISVPKPYNVMWKVLNRGPEAKKRNCIRGQLFNDRGKEEHREITEFRGDHIVECYILKNNIVVARQEISVPIDE